MSSLADSGAIFNYHRDMIAFHGEADSKALGWRDTHSQMVRFEALANIGDLTGCTVLDAGCGYGDLSAYLKNYSQYHGIEQIPELLKEAEKRYGNLINVTFTPGNFMFSQLLLCDYVLACGSLNYRSEDDDFIFKAIARLFNSCKIGLGFNLLSHIKGEGLIVVYDPETILSYCKKLCTNVIIINDYDEDDYTIFMYR